MSRWVSGSRCTIRATISVAVAVACVLSEAAHAITPGRSWTAAARLDEPGYSYLAGPRLDTASGQGLTLWATAIAPVGDDNAFGYRWRDSTWARGWDLGRPPVFLWPVLSPAGAQYLIWEGAGPTNRYYLWFSRVESSMVAPPETVASITPFQPGYSAAVSGRTRWAAYYDQMEGSSFTRLFTSIQPGIWAETRPGNYGWIGVALAPLDDSTAAFAWTNGGTLNNGVGEIRSGAWHDAGLRFGGLDESPNRPRFRPRPSGGLWLAWGTRNPTVRIATYRNGVLSVPDTLRCAYKSAPISSFVTDSPDLSRDDGEYPAVAWGSNIGYRHEYLSVLVPTDSGFTVADELQDMPGSLSTVARDANGDVWVAAWGDYGGVYWAHTYTSVTVSALTLQATTGGVQLQWQLSSPAPETWWAVLRASGAGPFGQVARIRAGASAQMTWTDPSPPPGGARYRIRRECLDARYRWESAEVSFPTGAAVSLVSATAAAGRVDLTWSVSGVVSVDVYRSWDSLGWISLGHHAPDEKGLVSVVDTSVKTGRRYGYRLGIPEEGGETYAGETWLDVPAAAEFSLRRVFPNPALGGFAVSFSLPSAATAQLEIFDLSGRRVATRDVGSLGPGVHTLSLGTQTGRLPAGIYAVRLTQGRHEATAKVSVLR